MLDLRTINTEMMVQIPQSGMQAVPIYTEDGGPRATPATIVNSYSASRDN